MLANHRLHFTVLLLMLVAFVTCLSLSTRAGSTRAGVTGDKPVESDLKTAEGLAAWDQVYSVLISPRCINCHTATNYPQQGDDRHRHFANVVRGRGGRGVPGLNCLSCHRESNADSTGVPGGHNWHLAPLSMQWQDENDQPLSSAAVCRALIDRSKNHGLDGPALLKHNAEEPLVLWAWSPGRRPDGTMRTLPPISHAAFVAATRTWVEAGTPCSQGR